MGKGGRGKGKNKKRRRAARRAATLVQRYIRGWIARRYIQRWHHRVAVFVAWKGTVDPCDGDARSQPLSKRLVAPYMEAHSTGNEQEVPIGNKDDIENEMKPVSIRSTGARREVLSRVNNCIWCSGNSICFHSSDGWPEYM